MIPDYARKIIHHPILNKTRPERVHLTANPSGVYDPLTLGIRTYGGAGHESENEFNLEKRMSKKRRIGEFQDVRNGIGCKRLGEKAYGNPIYQQGFYKTPGLITGSTNNNYHKRNHAKNTEVDFNIDKNAVWPMRPRVLWANRLKQEELEEDMESVKVTDNWERAVLKDIRPGWKDPDALSVEEVVEEPKKTNQKAPVVAKPPARKK